MGKYNAYLDVEVSCTPSNDGASKILTFSGIKIGDQQAILDRIMLPGSGPFFKPNPSKNISKAWFKAGMLHIMVPVGKEDDFLNTGLKSIQGALIKSGNYDNDSILRLTDETASRMDDALTKQQKSELARQTDASEIDMWTNYLNKVNDPETRKVLELYSQVYGDTVYGHNLSLRNVIRVRSIDSNATFVLGRAKWAEWGRGVRRGAKKFPLYGCSFTTNPTQADIKAAQDILGHGLEEFGELGLAVQQEVSIKASQIAAKNGNKFPIIYTYIGYDISDTYQYNPKEDDPLQTKPNISSNIFYALNDLARIAEEKKKSERGETISGDDEMKNRTKTALEVIDNMCQEMKLPSPIKPGAPDSSCLVDGLLSIYSQMITPKANVLKAGNVLNMAEDCTHLTLIMDNIGLDQLNRFKHPLVYTQKDMAALAPIIRRTIYKLGSALNKNLQEGIMDMADDFITRLKAAMKQIGMKVVRDNTPEEGSVEPVGDNSIDTQQSQVNVVNENTIKENFNKWLSRINNSEVSQSTRLML